MIFCLFLAIDKSEGFSAEICWFSAFLLLENYHQSVAIGKNPPYAPETVLRGDDSGWEDLPKNLERICGVFSENRLPGLGLSSVLEVHA